MLPLYANDCNSYSIRKNYNFENVTVLPSMDEYKHIYNNNNNNSNNNNNNNNNNNSENQSDLAMLFSVNNNSNYNKDRMISAMFKQQQMQQCQSKNKNSNNNNNNDNKQRKEGEKEDLSNNNSNNSNNNNNNNNKNGCMDIHFNAMQSSIFGETILYLHRTDYNNNSSINLDSNNSQTNTPFIEDGCSNSSSAKALSEHPMTLATAAHNNNNSNNNNNNNNNTNSNNNHQIKPAQNSYNPSQLSESGSSSHHRKLCKKYFWVLCLGLCLWFCKLLAVGVIFFSGMACEIVVRFDTQFES